MKNGTFPDLTETSLATLIRRGMDGDYVIKGYTIGPEVAAVVLAKYNPENRGMKGHKVAQYARDMAAGRWKDKAGQSISFNVKGYLDNGQNRLAACIAAEAEFRSLVIFGTDADAFDVIDQLAPRTARDTLYHRGVANATTVASTLALVEKLGRGSLESPGHLTHDEVVALERENPDVHVAAAWVDNHHKDIDAIPSVLGLCYLLMGRVDEDARDRFFDKLASGAELPPGHPVLTLRNTLRARRAQMNRQRMTGRFVRVEQYAMIVRAWNAVREGREIRTYMRVHPDRKTPEIV